MHNGNRQTSSNASHPNIQPIDTNWLHTIYRIVLLIVLVVMSGLLLWLGQFAAAVLLIPAGLLIYALQQRDQYARTIAQQITTGNLNRKFEVNSGALGELSRAVNHLVQEQRVQMRRQSLQPTSLPSDVLQALMVGQLPSNGTTRMTAVLLVSYPTKTTNEREQQATLLAWQDLAHEAHACAERHGALLQPCGGAILLAFGAFSDQPVGKPLREALAAAEELQRYWRANGRGSITPLVLSLAIGQTLTVLLPGLGYCVLGAPVQEALQLQQVAQSKGQYGLISGEGVYYARRQTDGAVWQPTPLRISAPNRVEQVVYTHVEYA
jgi:class 3 adenylate cyclase